MDKTEQQFIRQGWLQKNSIVPSISQDTINETFF